jgi:hypothetical protein
LLAWGNGLPGARVSQDVFSLLTAGLNSLT